MPRSLVLGNGSLLATFDAHLQMRDLYYPYIGMEDHTAYGDVHRVGVSVEGKEFSWLSDKAWKVDIRYAPETLMGHSLLRNDALGLEITVRDYVHPVHNILLRHFLLKSTDNQEKTVKLFFHHDFHIYGDKKQETAFYEPYTNAVVHYRKKRYFLIGGTVDRPVECVSGVQRAEHTSILRSREHLRTCGISSFTTGKTDCRGMEGTWRDAEDGELQRNPIEQGSVDSVVSLHCLVDSAKETEAVLWLCLGTSLDEVLTLQQTVLEEGPESLQHNCYNYWKSWVNKMPYNFGTLDGALIDLYKRSLLIARTNIDNNGGIVAAADSDIMAFNHDNYCYVWPRDGAFVVLALDRAGYGEVSRRFFEFCCRTQMPDGYLLHKYNPDGSAGSSWHPWYREGEPQLPIQEDETALVVYAIWKHFERTRDFEFLQQMYERFVRKAANFLCAFREEQTGLPLPSYDLWEEHRGVFTYTTACVIAGLYAAAQITHVLGHYKHFELYQNIGDTMKQALLFHLFDEATQRFVKKIKRKRGETTEKDLTPDASLAALWFLDVLSPDDPRIVATMEQLRESLSIKTEIGGLARYVNDHYQAATPHRGEIPGNPWIITTLWMAQWDIARAKTPQQLESARKVLEWVQRYASPAGIIAEQLHPLTGMPLSVAPLSWSHAAYVETVLQFLEKESSLLPHAFPINHRH